MRTARIITPVSGRIPCVLIDKVCEIKNRKTYESDKQDMTGGNRKEVSMRSRSRHRQHEADEETRLQQFQKPK